MSYPINPESKHQRILAVLREGPATTGEVAASLHLSVKLTCAHLKNLMKSHRITRDQFPTGNRRIKFIWKIEEAV